MTRILDAEKYRRFTDTRGRAAEAKQYFTDWVQMWTVIRPPKELADFYKAKTLQYSSQIQQGGLSHISRDAFLDEAHIVNAMPQSLLEVLLQEGCLTQLDLAIIQSTLEGIRRTATRGPAPATPTVLDYAQRCGDVRLTVPVMDSADKHGTHLLNGMKELIPSPELEQFHEHMLATLEQWVVGKRP